MKIILFRVSLILSFCLLWGCESLKETEQMGSQFYEKLKTGNVETIIPMIHPEGLSNTSGELWINLFREKNIKYGKLKSFKNTGFKAKNINGKNSTLLKYEVTYEKMKLYELLVFEDYNGKELIAEYRYNESENELKPMWDNF